MPVASRDMEAEAASHLLVQMVRAVTRNSRRRDLHDGNRYPQQTDPSPRGHSPA